MRTTAVDKSMIIQPVVDQAVWTAGDAPAPAPASFRSETSSTDGWKTARSNLLDHEFEILGPDGKPTGSIASYLPLEVALDAWDEWAQAEDVPAPGDGLPGGSHAIETGQFLTAYVKFVDERPSIKAAVVENLRIDPEIRAKLSEDPKTKPFFERTSDSARTTNTEGELIREVIRKATAARCYLSLAAAIYPPVLEAACASFLQRGDFQTQDLTTEYERDCGLRLDQLTTHANLDAMRHARAAYSPGTTGGILREATITGQASRAAKDQLVFRDGALALGPNSIEQAQRTATLQSLVNRVAPRHEGTASVAAGALLAGADQDSVSRMHEAIAITVAKAIPTLPGSFGQATYGLMHRGTAPGQFPLRFRVPGGPLPFALTWQPREPLAQGMGQNERAPSASAKSVSFNPEAMLWEYDRDTPASPNKARITDACAAARAALSSGEFTARTVPVLEAWDTQIIGMRGPAPGDGLAGGLPGSPTRHFLSAFDRFIVGHPGLEDAVEANFLADPLLRPFLAASRQAAETVRAAATNSVSEPRVHFDDDTEAGSRLTMRQAIRRAIVCATGQEHYLELGAAIDAPVLEALCAGILQPGDVNPRTFRHRVKLEMKRKSYELKRDAESDPASHERVMFGSGSRTVSSGDREQRLATIAAEDARTDLTSPNFKWFVESDARHTTWLRSLLDGVDSSRLDAANMAPEAFFGGADRNTVSMIHDAIALSIADSISALPRHADCETGLLDIAQHFGEIRITSGTSSYGTESGTPRLRFRAPSDALWFSLEQQPGSDRVNVVRSSASSEPSVLAQRTSIAHA